MAAISGDHGDLLLGPLFRHHHWLLRSQRFAGVGGNGDQQSFFAIDQVAGIEGGQLKAVPVRDGVRWAGLNAIAAEDAAVIVDVIDLGVALCAAYAVLFSIFGGLNVNAVGRTGGRAKETGHAFFQTIFVALQLMQSAEALLKNRALIGQLFVGIVLNNGGRKHLPQGYGHPFRNASQVAKDTKDRHAVSIKGRTRNWESQSTPSPRPISTSIPKDLHNSTPGMSTSTPGSDQ